MKFQANPEKTAENSRGGGYFILPHPVQREEARMPTRVHIHYALLKCQTVRIKFSHEHHATKLSTASTRRHCGWHLILIDDVAIDTCYVVVCVVMRHACLLTNARLHERCRNEHQHQHADRAVAKAAKL